MLIASFGAPGAPPLGGFREDVIATLGPFVGTTQVQKFFTSLESEIRKQAEIGARRAIPDITAEVESTARTTLAPIVTGAIAVGALGFIMGGIALYFATKGRK